MSVLPSKNISVVVQGPVVGTPADPRENRLTLSCLESIRTYLPGAEIILSTWKGHDVTDLPFDRLIENDDPGALHYLDFPKLANNVNRQIVATRNGLLAATRPLALKLRSDMRLSGTGFLRYFDTFPARSAWSVLRSKVVVSTIYSRIPAFVYGWVPSPEEFVKLPRVRGSQRLIFGWPYHPSDWFQFGWREDVLDIWDIPLAKEPETSRWFVGRQRPSNDIAPTSMNRYTQEQYIWLSFLRKRCSVTCDYQWHITLETVRGSEESFAGNLIMISPTQAGIVFAKYRIPRFSGTGLDWLMNGVGSCYTHGTWKEMYMRICASRRLSSASVYRARVISLRAAYPVLNTISALRTKVARMRGRIP